MSSTVPNIDTLHSCMKDEALEIAYLGPEGSFAHLVAQKRYETGTPLIPFRTVPEVFEYLKSHENAKGILPIENSSGGTILQTVDGLIENVCSLYIEEELSINVTLALLGIKNREIRTIYSHFAPLQHCEPYVKERFPQVTRVPCPSTSGAAEAALKDPYGAAIATLVSAEIHGLDVLEYPLRKETPNVTEFFLLGRSRKQAGEMTSLVVALPNHPGSLYDFLKPWKDHKVNLRKLVSRPVVGEPNTYLFFVEIADSENALTSSDAMSEARAVSESIKSIGSYPVRPSYQS